MKRSKIFESQLDETDVPPLREGGLPLWCESAWLGEDEEREPAEGNRQGHQQPGEPFWGSNLNMLEAKPTLAILEAGFNPPALLIPGHGLMSGLQTCCQIPGFIWQLVTRQAGEVSGELPRERQVEDERARTVMIQAKVDCWLPALFAASQPFFPQFPALARFIGQTSPAIDPHDVIEAVALEPGQERGAGKASVSQNDGAYSRGECLNHRQKRGLFQLVLALPGGQGIAVIRQLHQRQRSTSPGHGNAQHLITAALSVGELRIKHRPIQSQAQPPGRTKLRDGPGDEGDLHSQGVDTWIVEETPEPFEPVEQVMLGKRDAAGRWAWVGTGEF